MGASLHRRGETEAGATLEAKRLLGFILLQLPALGVKMGMLATQALEEEAERTT